VKPCSDSSVAAVPPPSPQTAEHHGHPVGHPRVLQDPPCDRGIRRRELHGQALDVGTYSLKDLAEPTRIWRIAGDTAPPRATPARRTNVQPTRTSFVGRTAELDRLRDLVGQPGLLTVRGPGGTGKPRIVSELALQEAESLPGGVWLVELATLDSPDQLVGTAGTALGLHSQPGRRRTGLNDSRS
jgi:hypothetical protein